MKSFLDKKVAQYNHIDFISTDPVAIPHRFSVKQDIEISGLFAAVFAWGNRNTILKKANLLMDLMDGTPYDFIIHHKEKDLKRFNDFCHRTFNCTDLLYFITFLKYHYSSSESLETAFFPTDKKYTVEEGLNHFRQYFFSLINAPQRTKKHISSPATNSSCKRLNMYLRWMVRKDDKGVDFGIWNAVDQSELIIPIDLHVMRVALKLGLLQRKIVDWTAAIELTNKLKEFDPADPVKYDFALFGMGVNKDII